MANSSPPNRGHGRVPRGRPSGSRSATSMSSRSPIGWPRVSLTSLKRSRSSRATATPAVSSRAILTFVLEEVAVGQLGERVVRRLPLVEVLLVLDLLEVPGALEVGAGMRNEGLEEAEVVLVEFVELLVAVHGDDRADGHVLARRGAPRWRRGTPRRRGRTTGSACSAVVPVVQRRGPGPDRLGDEGRRVECDQLDPRRLLAVAARYGTGPRWVGRRRPGRGARA